MQCTAFLKSGDRCSRQVTSKTKKDRMTYQNQNFDEATLNMCLCGTHFRMTPEFGQFRSDTRFGVLKPKPK